MASSSHDIFEETIEETLESTLNESMEQTFNEEFENLSVNRQQATKSKKKRAYIDREREDGHNRLWNDYFCENATYPNHLFRRRFRMNKPLFMRIVTRLANEVSFFQRRRDATGRLGLSGLQKATTAIRMMAYGCAADAVDVSEFAQVESNRSSHVDFMYSKYMPSNTCNVMAIRTRLRDRNIHEQLKII